MTTFSRHREESGAAIVVVIAISLAMVLFVLAGAKIAVSASHSAQRSKDSAAANAAAESGIRVATFQLNQAQPSTVECPVVATGADGKPTIGRGSQSGTWCPQRVESLGDSRSYTYAIKEGDIVQDRCRTFQRRQIVSQGISNGVRRTVTATVSSVPATASLPNCGIIVRDRVSMINRSKVEGDVVSGGEVYLTDNAQLCGNLTLPALSKFTFLQNASPPAHLCNSVNAAPLTETLPQGSPPTSFDLPTGAAWQPTCPGPSYNWNAAKDELTLTGTEGCKARLTLPGTNYKFCQLTINNNAELRFSAATPVKIWIQDIQTCGPGPRSRVNMNGSSLIVNESDKPANLQFQGLGYNRKADGTPSDQLLRFELWSTNPQKQKFIINAPNYDISQRNGTFIVGSVTAQEYLLDDHSRLTFSDVTGASGVTYNYAFVPRTWLECKGVTVDWASPDQVC